MPPEILRLHPVQPDDYDAVAYPGTAHPNTHPNRLAVMGLLHGLDPAPVERCRVLDIGCNNAANIIPMAYAMPGSEFVGFDLFSTPIAQAQRRIEELGLKNIRVFQANLMEVDETHTGEQALGTFDYIIAHGVYAWVPEPVRDELLSFCRRHLAPHGVAFISYNALPGYHVRNLVRDILLQPVATGDPLQDMNQAVQFLRFIADARPAEDPYRLLLEKELLQIERKGLHVLYHDEMAAEQRPVSFSTFIAHANVHGLQYLSDSLLPPPKDPCYLPQVAQRAKALANGDPIAEEQILDFARMRMYRETLLCHADREIDQDLRLDAFDRLRLASQAQSFQPEDSTLRVFTLPGGMRMESENPATIVLMDYLIAADPQRVPLDAVGDYLASRGIDFDSDLLTLLLRLIVSRFVDLHAWNAPVSDGIAERPRANAITRRQAVDQDRAVTLLHTTLGLHDPIVRQAILLLDGTLDRAALLQALREKFPGTPETKLAEGIGPALELLHRTGVFMADEPR